MVEVTNEGTSDWPSATVYINGDPPFAYKWEGTAPAVGQSIKIPLREFDKKGERFDPMKFKVTDVWVGGSGYDFRKFGVK